MNNSINEIIYLQLKKPKKWNWEISTSKSSPNIALPIIQLYNTNGKLLVQTTDDGSTQRQSWHSLQRGTPKDRDFGKRELLNLQRSRSDNLGKKHPLYRSAKEERNILQCTNRSVPVPPERKLNSEYMMAIISKISEPKMNKTPEQPIRSYQRRSKSDANLQKTNKRTNVGNRNYNIKNDYNNSLNSEISYQTYDAKKLKEHDMLNSGDKRKKKYPLSNLAIVEHNPQKPQNLEINYQEQPKKYRLRQSRAGILVISEESFSSSHRRRYHGAHTNYYPNRNSSLITGYEASSLENLMSPKNIKNTFRDCDQPKKYRPNINIRHSESDIFPCGNTVRFSDKRSDKPRNKKSCVSINDSYKYMANTPLIATDKKINKDPKIRSNSDRNLDRRRYDENCSPLKFQKNRTGSLIGNQNISNGVDGELLHLLKQLSLTKVENDKICQEIHQKKRKSNEPLSDNTAKDKPTIICDEKPCHVNNVMGANVSRHSTKGFSGRRSQSSGSLCNGKGRNQGDGSGKGSGGSLPGYLDDRASTSTNEYAENDQKSILDETERIPPLGDGVPLHWKFSDSHTTQCQDQGYGSERSPEEEYPPPLPGHDLDQCHLHLEAHSCYPFITPESTFSVKLNKGSRGLGLSVTGGIECGGSWPGLVRIKRLFPHQPASVCGLLNVGDLLLEANGVPLTGLTNYEALEVLRTATNQVELKVSRPPPDVLNCVSPISEIPPPPPTRREPEPPNSLDISSSYYGLTPEDEHFHGEFELNLTKIQGSLGFTLRKEDDSALGHYVRALVREPALTDGRIKAGDKIIAVNDIEIFPMTHEQAVQFLRQCGDKVKLRLYRDTPQTPVAVLSPAETTPRTSFSRKANLRQEAVDMLNDIAIRKLIPRHQQQVAKTSQSPTSSFRKLRRQNYPSDSFQESESKYLIPEDQFHEGMLKCKHFDEEAFNSLFTIDSDDADRPLRPNSLDLYNPNQTPVAARKPRFNFSLAHNAYELNNLDPEVLDAPNLTYNLGSEEGNIADPECGNNYPKEPASMPHIPLDNSSTTFSYKNPAYQSAHPPCAETDERSNSSASKSSQYIHKDEETDTIKRKKGILKKDSTKHMEKAEIKTELLKTTPMKEEFEIIAIELNRGWNSRLGFSLQGAAGVTYVSAVYPDSVAAKDGRIKPGDCIIKVNDEEVDHMTTNEIIDLLRIVRGPVCIFVKRIKCNEDCPKSNAEN